MIRVNELIEIKDKVDILPDLNYGSLIEEVNGLLEAQIDPNLYLVNAVFYRKSLQFTKAIEYATKGKKMFEKNNELVKMFECLYEIITCDFDQGRYKNVLEQYLNLESKMISLEIKSFVLTRTQIQITLCSLMLGRYRIAHEYLNKTKQNLDLVPEYYHNRFKAALSYINAKLFYDSGELQQALTFYEDAYNHYFTSGDKRNAERMLTNIAELHLKLGNLNQAEEIALEMFNVRIDSPTRRSYISNLLGAIYFQKGEYEKVINYCSFVSKMDNIDPTVRSIAHKLIALSYKSQGNYLNYEKNIEKSEEFSAKSGHKGMLEEYIAKLY